MSAARVTVALIFVALACFAIGLGVGSALAPADSSVEKVVTPPIPSNLPELLSVPQVALGAPVLGRGGADRPTHQPQDRRAAGRPAAQAGRASRPTAQTADSTASPAANNSPCYHVPCRRGLFRRR